MNKRVKLCLALFLAFAVIVQYSFSPQAMIAYGEDGGTVTATEASDQAAEKPAPEPTQATTAPKPAPEPSTSSDSSGSSGSSDSSASSDSSDATEPTESTEPADDSDGSGDDANTDAEDPTTVEETVVDEEEAEEEEEEYPAVSFTRSANGMTVNIHAPEGALPEGADVKVSAVSAGSVENAVENLIENSEVVKAVDITFYDKDGKEIEPKKDVSVTFTSSAFSGLNDAKVVHIKDNGVAEKVGGSNVSGNKATFKSDEFSVYVIVETEVPRLAVNFVVGGSTTTMYIKEADTPAEVETIIYDPGVGTIPAGQVFKGWTTDQDYTTSSTIKTIAQIRTDAMDTVKDLTADSTVTYYPVFFKQFTITYVDGNDIVVGTEAAEMPANADGGASYKVNMSYATDSNHNFEGWRVSEETQKNIVNYPEGASQETIGTDTFYYYTNGTTIAVTGDVTFTVNAPEGHWLVFDENGKGATYNAPQFVKAEEVTSDEDLLPMTRKGYDFDAWYYGTKDEETGEVTFGDEFEFGGQLTENTTIYAKWNPIEEAGYTIILWTQNQNRNGYDVKDSYVGTGTVGDNIPYTVVDNGDEDYVTGVGEYGHYTGFCLKDSDKNRQVEITPEGNAVLNLHFDRIEYNFKFYIYRDGTGNRYDYANNSGNGSSMNDLVTWHSNQTQHPSVSGHTLQSEQVDGRTYYYFTMSAYYGEDISSKWPKYSDIIGANGREAVSFVMMVGTKLKPNATNQGSGTVKGIVTVLNENILGKTNDANGNYVIVRFPDNYNNWRYHIWFEAINGEPPAGKPTREYGGKTYYEDTVLVVRSSNTEVSSQNEPKYTGFDFKEKRGQNWNNSNSWTTREDGTTVYHLNFVYDRQVDNITYLDGAYFDGEGKIIASETSRGEIDKEEGIEFGTDLSSYGKGGVNYFEPDPDSAHAGYVFEGWCTDEGCSAEYTFTTMPVGGITVYAKWRQIQYRVFLHPNASPGGVNDPTLSWGKNEEGQEVKQDTNFRVSYGGQVSTPTGTRTGYEFFGWYTDPGCSNAYPSGMALNESTVTADYDKTAKANMTDPSDKWGNANATSNHDSDRFWITKKLDLYAKWNEVTVGANGINVLYDATEEGTGAPTDTAQYKDNTKAVAGAASVAKTTDKVFSHWAVQKWNGTEFVDSGVTAEPGAPFTVLKSNAIIVDKATGEVVDPKAVQEGGQYIYTVQLKAVYKDVEKKTPTHIAWYSNYGSDNDGKGTLYRYDKKDSQGNDILNINEAVDILGAQTRAGYTFKGWTKTKGGTTADFLVWTGSGYEDADGNAATQVAADQKDPIEDLFAVWAESEVTINYAVHSDSTGMGTVSPTSETVKVSTGTAQGSTASPASNKYAIDYWTCDDSTEKIGTNAKFTPSKNAGLYEAHTYYAHFKTVPVEVTVTVHHYLKGTDTQVADDVTATKTVGSEYKAQPVSTYQGKNLTVDSCDPSQTITVSDDGNVITIYYRLPLSIEAKTASKTYDKTPLNGEYILTGALASDEAAIKEALGTAPSITYISDSPREYKATIPTDIPKYYEVTNNKEGTLTINKRNVTITTPSASKAYDGTALTNHNYTISGDGFVKGEEPAIVVTGSQTEVGSSRNTFTYSFAGVTGSALDEIFKASANVEDNYIIHPVLGTLTVTPATVPTPPPPTPTPTPDGDGGGPAAAVAAAPIVDTPVPTTIDEPAPPKAVNAYWALINLLCAIATALLSLIMLIRYFGRRKEEEELTDPATGELLTRDVDEQRGGLARIASLIPAIGGIIAFILTEDMSLPMAMVDKWTVLMIVILAVQAGVGIVAKLRDERDDEDEEEATA